MSAHRPLTLADVEVIASLTDAVRRGSAVRWLDTDGIERAGVARRFEIPGCTDVRDGVVVVTGAVCELLLPVSDALTLLPQGRLAIGGAS